jgi:hypothetical protein
MINFMPNYTLSKFTGIKVEVNNTISLATFYYSIEPIV